MLPDLKRFLESYNITDIDKQFDMFACEPSEWLNYKFILTRVDNKYSFPFFEKTNTAMSMFACGRICDSEEKYKEAIRFYTSYCEKGNPDNDGHRFISKCYKNLGDIDNELKYMIIGADSGDKEAAVDLARKYEFVNLRKSRHYYKLAWYFNSQTRIEHKLLAQFDIQLNREDFVLAYKLKVKYNKPGRESLRILIENEYFDALGQILSPWGKPLALGGLIKDLSNIVVSYLIDTPSRWVFVPQPLGTTYQPLGSCLRI